MPEGRTPLDAKPTLRLWRYLKKRRLACPLGHHFRERAEFPESGFLRCEHYIGAEHRECGLWVFILAIRGGGCIVAEVSLDEKTEMEELVTPAQMIEYLGIFDQVSTLTPAAGIPSVSSARSSARPSPDHHRRR